MNTAGFDIITRDAQTIYFVGVTTRQSSIMRIFPLWAEVLGLERAQIVGVDLPLHASPEQYRQAVAQIKSDPLSLGALVTTHKIDLFRAAVDLFDTLDPYAQLCREVSCISKRDGRLIGHAKDPATAGLSLQFMLESGYWGSTRGHVLCLGAGGSAVAIVVHLTTRPDPADRPARILTVDINHRQIDHLQNVVRQLPPAIEIDNVLNVDPTQNDRLMYGLPPGSLVINATGMGKDRPGSPITDAAIFPERGIAWELNYRGELKFLRQAQAQAEQRHLAVHDGWHYFLHGWSEVVSEVFGVDLTPERFERLARAAEIARV
jgi:shikimate 5-dehydrogenase